MTVLTPTLKMQRLMRIRIHNPANSLPADNFCFVYLRFKGSNLDNQNVDFSDRLRTSRRKGKMPIKMTSYFYSAVSFLDMMLMLSFRILLKSSWVCGIDVEHCLNPGLKLIKVKYSILIRTVEILNTAFISDNALLKTF